MGDLLALFSRVPCVPPLVFLSNCDESGFMKAHFSCVLYFNVIDFFFFPRGCFLFFSKLPHCSIVRLQTEFPVFKLPS